MNRRHEVFFGRSRARVARFEDEGLSLYGRQLGGGLK